MNIEQVKRFGAIMKLFGESQRGELSKAFLLKEIGVSERTLKQDFADMRELGCPVEYDRKRKKYTCHNDDNKKFLENIQNNLLLTVNEALEPILENTAKNKQSLQINAGGKISREWIYETLCEIDGLDSLSDAQMANISSHLFEEIVILSNFRNCKSD